MRDGVDLTVIEGGSAGRLALSLVHPRERIDVPVRSVIKIEARSDALWLGYEMPHAYERAHVSMWFAPSVQARICDLTRHIVGQPLAIVVDNEIVTSPIVREPLCGPGFNISVWGLADAEALAQKMRAGWRRPDLRVVSGQGA